MVSTNELQSGKLTFRQIAVEDFDMNAGEKPFDMAVDVRVGALDGRHLEIEKRALQKIVKYLTNSVVKFVKKRV